MTAMKLYLLRHGKANWPDWTGPDEQRPLTKEGIEAMEEVAAALKRLKVEPALIVTSPLPRALSTAEITAKALGVAIDEYPDLAPGFDRRKLTHLMAAHPGADLMIVGHEPDFSRLIRSLTGGRVKLARGAIAAVEIEEDSAGARLLWLFPPKLLIRLAD